MGFEFNPADDEARDPHGECREEIHRLQAEVAGLRAFIARHFKTCKDPGAGSDIARQIEDRNVEPR